MFDVKQLETSKIIFNHVPKAGGSSLYFFFQNLFGPEKVFRYKTRNVETEVTMEDLSAEDKEKHAIFQGHFHYGYHELFEQPCVYFGIIRDPIERIVSSYFYRKSKGREEAKEHAKGLTLEEFFDERIREGEKSIGHFQTNYLTGETSAKKAREVIENSFFLCCTTRQLDGCQRLLSQIYKKKVPSMKRNVTASDEKSGETLDALKAKYKDIFETDYATMRFIRNFYLERRDEIRKQLGAKELTAGKATARPKPGAGAKKSAAAAGAKQAAPALDEKKPGTKPAPKKAQPGAAGKKAAGGGPAAKKATAGPAAKKAAVGATAQKKPGAKPGPAANKTGPAAKKATGPSQGPGARKAGAANQKAKATQGAKQAPAKKAQGAKSTPARKAQGAKKPKANLKVAG